MHRSGTSAITRALGLLGADMGPKDHLGQYWENRYLRRTNQRLLGDGGTWDTPPVRRDGWRRGSKSQLSRARQFVRREFGDSPVAVWKDPRTCLTLPFWRRVFEEQQIIVLIHRHPLEVVGSLAARNQLGVGHVLAVWERYNSDALRFSSGLPTVVIEYGQILNDPRGVLGALVETMRSWGVELPNDPNTTDLELSSDSRHHQAKSTAELDHSAATRSQRQLFNKLAKLEGPHDKFKADKLHDPHPLSLEILQLIRDRRQGWTKNEPELPATPVAVAVTKPGRPAAASPAAAVGPDPDTAHSAAGGPTDGQPDNRDTADRDAADRHAADGHAADGDAADRDTVDEESRATDARDAYVHRGDIDGDAHADVLNADVVDADGLDADLSTADDADDADAAVLDELEPLDDADDPDGAVLDKLADLDPVDDLDDDVGLGDELTGLAAADDAVPDDDDDLEDDDLEDDDFDDDDLEDLEDLGLDDDEPADDDAECEDDEPSELDENDDGELDDDASIGGVDPLAGAKGVPT